MFTLPFREQIRDLENNMETLEVCGIENGMVVHCTDFVKLVAFYSVQNPNSLAKDGGLDDETKAKKYVMSDEDYNQRPNTYRAFKLQTEQQRISESHRAEMEYPSSTVEGIHVGDRCEVSPGGRRGTVKWVGILESNSASKGGYWVGIALDEPTGRNNGFLL